MGKKIFDVSNPEELYEWCRTTEERLGVMLDGLSRTAPEIEKAGRAWAETLKQLQEQLADLGSALQDMLEMITNLHERVANLESSLAKS